ncbi:Uncharacterized protein dnm_032370 [Desulfonema magnum]|uniref:Uncharacterized protein n=1 Tax=Desulfonema magnum TaxID=45655 RepID=A0A975GMY5_9BACT|nr:Uncharacterized protein dnm_032370 [Desulfonema magnum]
MVICNMQIAVQIHLFDDIAGPDSRPLHILILNSGEPS